MNGADIAMGVFVLALLWLNGIDRSSRKPWDTLTEEQLKRAHRCGWIR